MQVDNIALHNYQSRTVKDARNPAYSNPEKTMMDLEVLFVELEPWGYVPFTANLESDTIHGGQLWQWAHEGKYGAISEYDPVRFAPAPQPPNLYDRVEALEAKVAALEQKVGI